MIFNIKLNIKRIDKMNGQINKEIEKIIELYNNSVYGEEERAKTNQEGRASGGVIRSEKGGLVEYIARRLVELAWEKLGQDPNRLRLYSKEIKIPIKQEYIDKLKDEEIKNYIKQNIEDYYYSYKPDILVEIDGIVVLEIECKAYTENAMLKRVLVDSTLLKTQYPKMKFILLQLESQLGGDFSELKDVTYGSPSTHTLLSYFDIELHIITLLKGERKVDKPIHKKEFFKPLTKESLQKAIDIISSVLEEFSK
jgi:hypothetical protein